MNNRVAIDRAITVESLMGPEVTIIQGRQVPGTTNGDGAIRCVYLTNGASLSGFTLTNGATRGEGGAWDEGCGGGLWCESTNAEVSNCVVVNNSAAYAGGGAYGGTLNNCTLTGNLASSGDGGVYSEGGGAYRGTLNNCTLTGNSAESGGGAFGGTLNNCTLTGNSAVEGGGAWAGTWEGTGLGTLNNCTLSGNSAINGGGVAYGTLNNCTLTGNSAINGGGAYEGDWLAGTGLHNCVLTRNSAHYGGGSYFGMLNNCTVTGNSATEDGGGVCSYSRLNNCIVYFNTATSGANFDSFGSCVLNSCCTTPLPTNGVGNITLEPQLASVSHLSASSPCRSAGSADYVSGTDIDGEALGQSALHRLRRVLQRLSDRSIERGDRGNVHQPGSGLFGGSDCVD